MYKVIYASVTANRVLDDIPNNYIGNITNENYTNILKEVHENIDTYVGQKIQYSGYIYRLYDFKENQFVLARDMIISSDFQTVVVGFLCESEQAKDFKDGDWVSITAKITKGNYNGEMPILKIESIEKIDKPSDEYVYPPNDNYIPTSVIY